MFLAWELLSLVTLIFILSFIYQHPKKTLQMSISRVAFNQKQEEARVWLENVMNGLGSLIDAGEPALLKDLVVFSERFDSMTPSQVASSLHKFGKIKFAEKNSK